MKTIKTVAILTDFFLHPEVQDFLATVENLELLQLVDFFRKDLSLEVDLFQESSVPERRFKDIRVHGFKTFYDRFGMYPGLNGFFSESGLGFDLRIYYHWNLTYPMVSPQSIVVSHGVFWDAPSVDSNRFHAVEREEWVKRLLYGISAPTFFVTEDRNTANVIKATWPGYEHRLRYIPPGIDLDRFKPPAPRASSPKVHVICPQDFSYEQGIHDILTLGRRMSDLKGKVEFRIVGHPRDFNEALQLAAEVRMLPNCRFGTAHQAHMPQLYREADLALFPSRATEGASLYCLQAMACGLPVVAGLAGGLGELVVDGWNGRLVSDGFGEMHQAVYELVENRELRLRMGRNARLMAEGYPLQSWKVKWSQLLAQAVNESFRNGDEDGKPTPPSR